MLPTRDDADQVAAVGALRPALRLAVHRLRSRHRGRSFAPVLHLGRLDGDQIRFPIAGIVADRALCLDVASALVSRCPHPQPIIWVSRSGDPEPRESDLAWLRGAWQACLDDGRSPGPAIVLTKGGWTAPFTDQQALWKRLRLRTPSAHSQECTGSLECISSR